MVEGGGDTEQLRGVADLLQQLEQPCPAHKVTCLRQIDEGNVWRHLLFSAFLLELANRENHVYRRSFRSKAALGLGVDAFSKNLESHQNHAGKDLSDDAQEGDTPVVVTIAPIAFVFVQGDDLGITHVLGYLTLSPTETEEFVQWLNQGWLPGFDDFRWNAALTWGFAARQGIDSLVDFIQCGLGVKLFEHG